jgi:ferredoxin-NADP reductase
LLKLKRPALFLLKPGQYAFLRAPEVDQFWHPFSIASDPNSNDWDVLVKKGPDESFTMEIVGQYGVGLVNKGEYSPVVAVGSGTGIVPILSLFKEHIHQVSMLNPTSHYNAQHEREIQLMKIARSQEMRVRHLLIGVVVSLIHNFSFLACFRQQSMTIFKKMTSAGHRCFKQPSIDTTTSSHKADRKTSRVKEASRRLSLDHHHKSSDIMTLPSSECQMKEMRSAVFSATRSSEFHNPARVIEGRNQLCANVASIVTVSHRPQSIHVFLSLC